MQNPRKVGETLRELEIMFPKTVSVLNKLSAEVDSGDDQVAVL